MCPQGLWLRRSQVRAPLYLPTRYLRIGCGRLQRFSCPRTSNHAATVLQPEEYRAEQDRIRFRTRRLKTAQISGLS
jgi:hypothetical protein